MPSRGPLDDAPRHVRSAAAIKIVPAGEVRFGAIGNFAKIKSLACRRREELTSDSFAPGGRHTYMLRPSNDS
jgi:hypothetical protein